MPNGKSEMGGATCARPEHRRMMSASDRRHLALLGSGLSTRVPPGLLRSRSGLTAPVGFGEPARTLKVKNLTCPPQARTGFPAPRLPPFGGHGTKPGPVAGFARVSKRPARQRNPDGLRLLSSLAARYGKPRKAFLPPGPTRSRSIRQREPGKCDTGFRRGEKNDTNGFFCFTA